MSMETDLARAIQQWRTQSAIGPERYGEIVPYSTLLKLAALLDEYRPIVEAAEALVAFWTGPEPAFTPDALQTEFTTSDRLTAALRDAVAARGVAPPATDGAERVAHISTLEIALTTLPAFGPDWRIDGDRLREWAWSLVEVHKHSPDSQIVLWLGQVADALDASLAASDAWREYAQERDKEHAATTVALTDRLIARESELRDIAARAMRAQAECAALRRCLDFYADADNYIAHGRALETDIERDRGARARRALGSAKPAEETMDEIRRRIADSRLDEQA